MLNNPSFFTKDTVNYSFIWDDCTDVSEQVELYVYYINGETVECCNIDNPILITYANRISIKEIHQVIQNHSVDEKNFKFKIKRSNEDLQSAVLFPVENISLHPSIFSLSVYPSERNIFRINGSSACQNLYQDTDNPLINYDIYVSKKTSETPPDWTELEWQKIETDFILDNTKLPLTFQGCINTGLNLDTEYYITLNYNRLIPTTYDFQANLFNTINQDVVDRVPLSMSAVHLYHLPSLFNIENKELLYLQKASYSTVYYTIELGDYSDNTFIKQTTLTLKVGETYDVSQYKYMRVSSSYSLSDLNSTIELILFSYRKNETTKTNIISEFKTAKAYSHDYEAFKGLESLTARYDENEHKYICSYQKVGPNNNELYVYQQYNDTYTLCNDLQYDGQEFYGPNSRQIFLLDPDFLPAPNNEKSYNVMVSDFAVKDIHGQIKTNNISQGEIDDIVAELKGYEYKCSLYKIANYKTQQHPEGEFDVGFYLHPVLKEKQQNDAPHFSAQGRIIGETQFKEYKNHPYDLIIQSTVNPVEKYVFGWGYFSKANLNTTNDWFLYDKTTQAIYETGIYLNNFKNIKHSYKIMIKVYSLNKKRYKIITEGYIDYNHTHFLQGLGYNYYPCGNKKQDEYEFLENHIETDVQKYDKLELNFNKNFTQEQISLTYLQPPFALDVKALNKIQITKIQQQGNFNNWKILGSFQEDNFLETSFEINESMEIDVADYDYLYLRYIKRDREAPNVVYMQYNAYISEQLLYAYFLRQQDVNNTFFSYDLDKNDLYYKQIPTTYDLKSIDKIIYDKQAIYNLNLQGNFQYTDYYDSYKEKPNKNFGVSIEKENVTDDIPSILYDDSEDLNNILYFGYSKNAQINQDYTNTGLHNYDTNVANAISKVSIFPKNSPLQTNMSEEKIWLTFKLTEMIQKNCIQNNMYPFFSIEQGDLENYRNRYDHNKKRIYFKASSIDNPNVEIHIDFGKQVIINSIKNLYAANCKTIEIRDEQDFLWYKGEDITNPELILLDNQKIKCKKLFIYITSKDKKMGRIESDDLQILLLEKAINPNQENKGLRNRFFKTNNIRLFLNTGDYLDYDSYIDNGQEIQGLVLNNNQPVDFYIEQFADLQNDTYGDLIYKLEIIKTEHLLFDLLPNDDNIVSLTQENKNEKIFTKDFNINSYTNNLTIKNSKIKKITFKKCQHDTLVNCFLEKEDRKE